MSTIFIHITTRMTINHIFYFGKDTLLNVSSYQKIELDGESISKKRDLIRSIYNQIGAPKTFGDNWDALNDTLSDQEFWITKPTVLMIKNEKSLLREEDPKDTKIFKNILTDLIQEPFPFLVFFYT